MVDVLLVMIAIVLLPVVVLAVMLAVALIFCVAVSVVKSLMGWLDKLANKIWKKYGDK